MCRLIIHVLRMRSLIPGRHKQEDRCKLQSHQQLHQGEPHHLQKVEPYRPHAAWLDTVSFDAAPPGTCTMLICNLPVFANTLVKRDTAPACLAYKAVTFSVHTCRMQRKRFKHRSRPVAGNKQTSSAYASLSIAASASCCIAAVLQTCSDCTRSLHDDCVFAAVAASHLLARLFLGLQTILSHFSIRSEATNISSQSNSSAMTVVGAVVWVEAEFTMPMLCRNMPKRALPLFPCSTRKFLICAI